MFPITVTIQNIDELRAVMSALGVADAQASAETTKATDETTTEAPAEAPTAEAPTTEAPAAEAPTTEAPAAEAPTTEAPTTEAPAAEAPAAAPSYQDAANAIMRLARARGRDAAVAVLAKFGAGKLPDVKPEHFAAVIAACEAAEVAE